jgi:Uncharacterized conserved protein
MRIAQINDCVACSDFRAPSVLDAGIAPELYENVAAYATYPGYTPRQRLAIEYAERFANAHASIDDAFFGRLRELFSDEEILDLTLCVAVFLGLGRSLPCSASINPVRSTSDRGHLLGRRTAHHHAVGAQTPGPDAAGRT